VDMADILIVSQRGLLTLNFPMGLVLQKAVFAIVFAVKGATRRLRKCCVSRLQRTDPSWSVKATTGRSRRVKPSQLSAALLTKNLNSKLNHAKKTANESESLLPNRILELPPAHPIHHRTECRSKAT
jgi:hypothetical protein